jgi:hypothetical protein
MCTKFTQWPYLPAVVLLVLLGALRGPADEKAKNSKADTRPPRSTGDALIDKYQRAVFFAVVDGLYEDGVPTDVVEAILAVDSGHGGYVHFVHNCPNRCVTWAFQLYRNRPVLYNNKPNPGEGSRVKRVDTFGPGLPDRMLRLLKSDMPEDRLAGIRELVECWVSRRLSALRLTEAEWEEFASTYEERRVYAERMFNLLRKEATQAKLLKAGVRFNNAYIDAYVGKSCVVCEGTVAACRKRGGS